MLKQEVVITDVSQCQKDISIEIAAEEVKKEFDKTYDAYSRHVKVPGFRPGRVPRDVVKQRFRKEVKDEVLGNLIPHALEHVVKDHNLKIVGQPRLAEGSELTVTEGESLKLKVSIEVLPEFELKEYKGLKITKRSAQVSDEDVNKVIERWREEAVEFVPVEDRPSKNGDFVSVNVIGKYLDPQEEHEKEDLKADGVEIELGAENAQPEFTENLQGVKPDDVREFRVAYPEDFESKGLAGKTLDFTATVLSVRAKELPELNDDFAKSVGQYETLQEMRDKVRENLAKNAEAEADRKLRDDLVDRLIELHPFDVPTVLVNEGTENRLREFSQQLQQMGIPEEAARSINWAESIKEAQEASIRDVRAALLIGKIGETEDLKVETAEIDAEIELMAQMMRQTTEELMARLTREQAIPSIENRLRYRKALEFLVSNADITTEEPTEASPEAQAAAE